MLTATRRWARLRHVERIFNSLRCISFSKGTTRGAECERDASFTPSASKETRGFPQSAYWVSLWHVRKSLVATSRTLSLYSERESCTCRKLRISVVTTPAAIHESIREPVTLYTQDVHKSMGKSYFVVELYI